MNHVPDLVSRVLHGNKRHAAFVNRALASLTDTELGELDAYVDHRLSEGDSLDGLASDYKLVVEDTLREQVYFMRHGRYRFSRYDEVKGAVYLNDAYMGSYMRGLAITSFFWPNHAKMRRFFEQELEGAEGRTYLEVGPGHGVYFLAAMRKGAFRRYEGIDISPKSVALTARLLDSGRFGRFEGWHLTVGDFLSSDIGAPVDMLVMGEVLEHVEAPERFLSRARELTTASSRIFVTTCINSPAFDHIYLFSTVDALRAMAARAGLAIERELVLPYDGTTLEESLARRLPINVAMGLRHD